MTARLCQRPKASCGACCGIYNRADPGRAAVRAELARRTRVLARAPRTVEGFREAAARLRADAPPALIPTIHACPLAGFLDAEERRVGCLAHPAVTGGVDLRSCGAYDVETCESFLCPSHAALGEAEGAILEAVTDFHLYGLVVTDAPFVGAVLDALSEALGERVEPRHARLPALAAPMRRLLALKEELAAGSEGLFGAFRHAAGGDGARGPAPDAPAMDAAARILEALGADARSGNDAELLEEELRARLGACVAAFRTARKPQR